MQSKFVGRARELAFLKETFEQGLRSNLPHMVSILGPEGIGKTRLVSEFLKKVKLAYPKVRVYQGKCEAYGARYSVITRILKARFGIKEKERNPQILAQLRKKMMELFRDRRVTEMTHFLGMYLGLKVRKDPFISAIEENPKQVQEISQVVLKKFFEIDAETSPLILIFENLHLAHEESLDLIQYLLNKIEKSPIMMIAVARPEILVRRPNWFETPRKHLRIDLLPFDLKESKEMTKNLLNQAQSIPEKLLEIISDIGKGNPFLIEHIVQIFMEDGTIKIEDERWKFDPEKIELITLPKTIDNVIKTRVGFLEPEEQEVLEKAALLGNEFWLGALIALWRYPTPKLEKWSTQEELTQKIQDVVDKLVQKGYLIRKESSSIPSEKEYSFKHTSVREVVFKKIRDSKNIKAYHRIIAAWLEHKIKQPQEEDLAFIARHYRDGGNLYNAAWYFINAANRARLRYANLKALRYYEEGLRLLKDDDIPLRITALHNYGDVLSLVGQNQRAVEIFKEMLYFAWVINDISKGGAAHNRIGRVYCMTGHLNEAMDHFIASHTLFQQANDTKGIGSSFDDLGKVYWRKGEYQRALEYFKEGLNIRELLKNERSIALSYHNIALCYHETGRFKEAFENYKHALKIRQKIKDTLGELRTTNNIADMYHKMGKYEKAIELWERSQKMAEEIGDIFGQTVILINLGEVKYHLGQLNQALAYLQAAETLSEQIGDYLCQGECARALGKAYMLFKDFPKAKEYLNKAYQFLEHSGSKLQIGIVLRTLGEVITADIQTKEDQLKASQKFLESIKLLEEIGAWPELIYTHKAYSKFLEKIGDKESAKRHKRISQEILSRIKR